MSITSHQAPCILSMHSKAVSALRTTSRVVLATSVVGAVNRKEAPQKLWGTIEATHAYAHRRHLWKTGLESHHVCMQVNTKRVIRKVQFLMLPWLWLMVVRSLLHNLSAEVLYAAASIHEEPTSFESRTAQLTSCCPAMLSHVSATST